MSAGQAVFAVAPTGQQALVEAEAKAGAAREGGEPQEPRRAPEIAALEANLQAALASQRLAQTRLRQQESLARLQVRVAGGASTKRAARSARPRRRSRRVASSLRRIDRRLPSSRGARRRGRAAAAALAEQKRWVVERKAVTAPTAGEVTEIYYRPGEWVPAGAAVASVLPDERRRLRFFVPETALAAMMPGLKIEAGCDGCATSISATVDFVAAQAGIHAARHPTAAAAARSWFFVSKQCPLSEQANHAASLVCRYGRPAWRRSEMNDAPLIIDVTGINSTSATSMS